MTEITTVVEVLGLLKLKSSLFVGLLPTNAEAVIVSYDNEIAVSCTIPPTSHNVQINFIDFKDDEDSDENGKLKILRHRAPRTLMTLYYHEYPNVNTVGEARIYAIDGRHKNKILGTPLLLPNVYSEGRICFGEVGRPSDLRSAYASFWNTPFNDTLDGYAEEAASNLDYIRRFKSLVLDHESYSDITDEICGTSFWSTQAVDEGILITNNKELLRKIPNKFWIMDKLGGDEPFIIAIASSRDDSWIFSGKGFTFEIDAKNVKTSQSANKKIVQLRKKFEGKAKPGEMEISSVATPQN